MMKSKGLRIAIILVGIIVVIVAGLTIFLTFEGRAVDKNNKDLVIVKIKEGSGTSQIAYALNEQGVLHSTFAFQISSKLGGYDGKYIAGSYVVSKSMTSKEIMKLITSGKTSGKVFRIIEGQTIEKIATQLENEKIVSKKDFFKEVENGKFNYDFMKDLPNGAARLEGFLYPDTYSVDVDATAHDVIDAMLKNFDKHITDEYYEQAKKQGYSMYEIITVASIIEKEAQKPDDKKNVASVIYNRLDEKMYLQMDSIVSYINKEDKIRATYDDIEVDSKYNPYKNLGLPPGPICSPGEKSIKAALYPPETDYMYFVASDKIDGTNVFSETYDEFLKDKAKFDKAYEDYIKEHPEEE